MYSTHTESRAHLATRFAPNARVLRSDVPLTEDQMRAVAPSLFAQGGLRAVHGRAGRQPHRPEPVRFGFVEAEDAALRSVLYRNPELMPMH